MVLLKKPEIIFEDGIKSVGSWLWKALNSHLGTALTSGLLAAIVSVLYALNQWQKTVYNQQLTNYKETIIDLIVFDKEGSQTLNKNGDKLRALRTLTSDVLLNLDEKNQQKLVQFLEGLRLLDKDGSGLLAENNLRGAKLKHALLAGVDLSLSDLSKADLEDAFLKDTHLSGANLSGARLKKAKLLDSDLSCSENSPRRTNLSGADLNGADLSGADLSGANLRRADLRNSKLEQAKSIKGAIYDDNTQLADVPNLSEAYKIEPYADLEGEKLSKLDLSKANLSMANLKGADLSFANLKGADLKGASLKDADLSGADLKNAEVSNDVKTIAKLCSTIWIDGNVLNPQETCKGIKIPHFAPDKSSVTYSEEPIATLGNFSSFFSHF